MSSRYAPLRVPVEIRAGSRWFRLAHAISPGAIDLRESLPDEVEGNFVVRFHLPEDDTPIQTGARAEEIVVGEGEEERAERRRVWFLDLDDTGRARIEAYVQERLGLFA
jgi:hypothetical protein